MSHRVPLAAAAAALALAACGGGDGTTTSSPDPVIRGLAVYEDACQSCHELAGIGIEGLGKPLAGSEFIVGLTDEELVAFVVAGRGTGDPDNTSGVAMPPRGGRPTLSDRDVRDVVAYLRTLQPDP